MTESIDMEQTCANIINIFRYVKKVKEILSEYDITINKLTKISDEIDIKIPALEYKIEQQQLAISKMNISCDVLKIPDTSLKRHIATMRAEINLLKLKVSETHALGR